MQTVGNLKCIARWCINLLEAKRGVQVNPLEPPLPTGLEVISLPLVKTLEDDFVIEI